jgi:hypothetical protein
MATSSPGDVFKLRLLSFCRLLRRMRIGGRRVVALVLLDPACKGHVYVCGRLWHVWSAIPGRQRVFSLSTRGWARRVDGKRVGRISRPSAKNAGE